MRPLRELMIERLDADEVHYSRVEDSSDLHIAFRLKTVSVYCLARIDEESRSVSFYTRSGIRCPEEFRYLCAELVTRINHRLRVGCFQMDWADGEIYYETCLWVGQVEIDAEMLRPIVHAGLAMYDHYYPAFVDVVYRAVSPEEALSRRDAEMAEEQDRDDVLKAEMDEIVRRLLEESEEEPPRRKRRRKKTPAPEPETPPEDTPEDKN